MIEQIPFASEHANGICSGLIRLRTVRLDIMNAVPFDTLKLARKLEASGLAAGIAAGTAEA
jgi:hypothetical protein